VNTHDRVFDGRSRKQSPVDDQVDIATFADIGRDFEGGLELLTCAGHLSPPPKIKAPLAGCGRLDETSALAQFEFTLTWPRRTSTLPATA